MRHLQLPAVALALLLSWGAIDQLDQAGHAERSTVFAAAPDARVDLLADMVLTIFLTVGAALGAYFYYAGKWIKEKLLRSETSAYQFHFLIGAFIGGILIGLAATKTLTVDMDRTWATICGGAGSLTAWGAYDLILAALLKKASGWWGSKSTEGGS